MMTSQMQWELYPLIGRRPGLIKRGQCYNYGWSGRISKNAIYEQRFERA